MDKEIYKKIQSLVKEKHTYHMNALDFRSITKLVYGKAIEMLESPNDTTHEYNADEEALAQEDEEALKEAVDCGGLSDWQYDIILNDLCHKGYLKPGKYLLRMSW